jgi:hypothetical protein
MLSEERTEIMPAQNAEDLQAKVDEMTDNMINYSKI